MAFGNGKAADVMNSTTALNKSVMETNAFPTWYVCCPRKPLHSEEGRLYKVTIRGHRSACLPPSPPKSSEEPLLWNLWKTTSSTPYKITPYKHFITSLTGYITPTGKNLISLNGKNWSVLRYLDGVGATKGAQGVKS